jgi:hypothetical protein
MIQNFILHDMFFGFKIIIRNLLSKRFELLYHKPLINNVRYKKKEHGKEHKLRLIYIHVPTDLKDYLLQEEIIFCNVNMFGLTM